jgi:hypothetical protein
MEKFFIISVKKDEIFVGSLDEAVKRARAIGEEYDPAYGVQIESENGIQIWDSEEELDSEEEDSEEEDSEEEDSEEGSEEGSEEPVWLPTSVFDFLKTGFLE